MAITRLTLKGDVPTKKNGGRMIKRGNHVFRVPPKAHEAWHEEQMWQLKTVQKPKNAPLSGLCSITCTIYPKTLRKSDLTNKAESVMDLLVDAGFLEDDNWFILGEVILRFGGKDKDNPRAEITIEYEEKEV